MSNTHLQNKTCMQMHTHKNIHRCTSRQMFACMDACMQTHILYGCMQTHTYCMDACKHTYILYGCMQTQTYILYGCMQTHTNLLYGCIQTHIHIVWMHTNTHIHIVWMHTNTHIHMYSKWRVVCELRSNELVGSGFNMTICDLIGLRSEVI